MTEVLVALGGALFGGAGLELLRRWLSRRDEADLARVRLQIRELEAADRMREELFAQVRALWDRVHALEAQLETERQRYADLRREYDELRARCVELELEVTRLRAQLGGAG